MALARLTGSPDLKIPEPTKEKANQEIAQNKAEALQSVKGEVADLTVSLAGKIISQNLDSHAHKELIDQYIDQLGEA